MTLPPRKTKPRKDKRWRSPAHLAFVRSHHCCMCGADAPIEAAHYRLGSGAGIGSKPDDWRCVSLCGPCHRRQHEVGENTFWDKAGGYERVMSLVEAFCRQSPKAREIREARNA